MGKFTERIENDVRKYIGPGFEPKNREYYGVSVEWMEYAQHIWVCTRRRVMQSCIKEWGYYVVLSWFQPKAPDYIDRYPNVEIEVSHEDYNRINEAFDEAEAITDWEISDAGGCGNPSCELCYPDDIPETEDPQGC